MNPIISAVIPVRNRKEITQKILKQIFFQVNQINQSDRILVIVVDDGSTDGTKEMINSEFPQVHLIEGDGTLWWAGAIVSGMNYALSNLQTDYVVWLNDDISLSANFIENLVNICHNSVRMETTIIGGIVTDETYPNWIVYGGFEGRKSVSDLKIFHDSEELEVNVLCGNIVVISRHIINKIGFPNHIKLPQHGGDFEYIMRATKAEIKIILSSKLRASNDYRLEDFIRYMPYLLQWYVQPSLVKRWEVIKGLTSYKANHSIWQVVGLHSKNRYLETIPKWKYILCYLNKLIRLLAINFVPEKKIQSKLEAFLEYQNPPQEIIDMLFKQSNQRSLK